MTAMQALPHTLAPTPALLYIPANNEELGRALTHLAGHINAAQYRFLKLLAALIEREAWEGGSGMKSPAHWLNYYCGIALGAAREKVRVAKCLESLPQIDAAFRSGAISYSKVRAMTRSATPENEAFLLQVALHGTAQHVEKLVRGFERTKRLNDPKRQQREEEAREFTCFTDEDGMLVFRGRLPMAEGAALLKALDAVMDTQQASRVEDVPAGTSDTENTPSTFAQRRADALANMADLALRNLTTGEAPVTGADKYQVVVHLDAHRTKSVPAGTSFSPACACSMESGGADFSLATATAQRLACDASLLVVLEDAEGKVLNVGRKTRTIPPAIRRALVLRDGGCRFPGCCEARFVDAHHIKHWCEGGETRLDNLVLLCRRHHRLLHNEGYAIAKNGAGEFTFTRADGTRLAPSLAPQFNEVDELPGDMPHIAAQNLAVGLHIDARTAVTAWQGERMDYGFAVGTLLDYGMAAPRIAEH